MKAGRDRHIAQEMIVGMVKIRDRDRLAGGRGLAEQAVSLSMTRCWPSAERSMPIASVRLN